MNYKISYIESIDVVQVIYSGHVSLSERKEAVNYVCDTFSDQKPLKILVNVCNLEMNLTLEEQHNFADYLALHPGLSHAKVAVVHKSDYNPNLLIDTCAFNNGYRLSEFIQIKEAEMWLCET